jgi:predicted CxxxxCH...CXXCH cytochrome family protein
MNMPPVGGSYMKRNSMNWALAIAAVGLAACGGQKSPEPSTATDEQKGQYGISYYVNVSRPSGGAIRSGDGKIDCGTAGGVTTTLCGPARYDWTQAATLSAYPDASSATDPFYFQSWAGDCGSDVAVGGCVLNTAQYGADKWVAAVFNTASRIGHGNILSPSAHAKKFFAFLGNDAGAARCNTCHGQSYAGQANAPSCNACHAAAGWANWQQSCSFCHGTKNATTMAGYVFTDGGVHQEWAAPPDDVNGRLTGVNGTAVGAHQAHVAPNEFRSPIACGECHVVPATAIHTLNHSLDLPFGPLSRSQGAVPTWEPTTLTCGANYCHGNFNYGGITGKAASLSWTGTLSGCTTCHDMPPAGHTYSSDPDPTTCSGCHADTVNGDGTINVGGGRHINGQKDATSGGACDSCHWYPNSLTKPATGAHLAHFGLTATQAGTAYGDLGTLELKYPTAIPTTAPSRYAFGCGNCHPISTGQHSMGSGSNVAKVVLYEGASGLLTGSIKAKNSPTASFNATTKTCSGVYCHSSGQGSPTFVTTVAWNSGAKLGCNSCHDNPPKYTSGGPGTLTANSHVQLDNDGFPWGHFGLPMTQYHPQHGTGQGTDGWGNPAFVDSSPVTCQTCHFGTTDPGNTGPNGFYYLDTTGDYYLPNTYGASYVCTACHSAGNATAPLGTGKVLPLRHVNGARDVEFDARTGNPNAPWIPGTADDPTRPYWITQGSTGNPDWAFTNRTFAGTTAQFDLSPARYDSANKTCSNVTCHMSQGNTAYTGTGLSDRFLPLRWGNTYYYLGTDPETGIGTCSTCHRSY